MNKGQTNVDTECDVATCNKVALVCKAQTTKETNTARTIKHPPTHLVHNIVLDRPNSNNV